MFMVTCIALITLACIVYRQYTISTLIQPVLLNKSSSVSIKKSYDICLKYKCTNILKTVWHLECCHLVANVYKLPELLFSSKSYSHRKEMTERTVFNVFYYSFFFYSVLWCAMLRYIAKALLWDILR